MRDGPDLNFEEFARAAAPSLTRLAWARTLNWADSEDLVQETLARMLLRWNRISDADLMSYARRVLMNLRVDAWRRRRHEVLSEDLAAHEDEGTNDGVEARLHLAEMLGILSPKQRNVVVLRHLLDLSVTETAQELGISESAVKVTSHRALKRMQEHWGSREKAQR